MWLVFSEQCVSMFGCFADANTECVQGCQLNLVLALLYQCLAVILVFEFALFVFTEVYDSKMGHFCAQTLLNN